MTRRCARHTLASVCTIGIRERTGAGALGGPLASAPLCAQADTPGTLVIVTELVLLMRSCSKFSTFPFFDGPIEYVPA